MSTVLSAPLRYDPSMEILEDDEAETIAELAATLRKISEITFKDSGVAMRSVHAKSHGLLKGELQVLDGLPQELAQGLFARARTLPVMIRLSTTPGDILDDRVSTPRGMAIKVSDVEGERLPGNETDTQDFVLVNGPAFIAPNIKKFLGSLKLLAATTDKAPKLKIALSAVLRGVEKVIESAGGESGALKGLGGHPQTHILGETFFSQAPILYGDYVAKLSVIPLSRELAALKDVLVDLRDRPNGIRDAVVGFFSDMSAEWELRVQLCTDREAMPIEDATVVWPETLSPYIPVARIRVGRQLAWNAAESEALQARLAFSPWHGLAAHRPLGSIMRARRVAYETSARFRAERKRQDESVGST
jgi:hypothetical protein